MKKPYYYIEKPAPPEVKQKIQMQFTDNFGKQIDKQLKEVSKEINPSDTPLNPASGGASQTNRDMNCMYSKNCTLENCLQCKKLK